MKVILLKDVGKVGQQGSVVDVADGFALNSLIPRGLAAQATAEKLAAHEAMQEQKAVARAHEAEALAATVRSVENARIELKLRATEKGGLFRAVTADDIAKALLAQRRALIPANAVGLAKPIKEVGEHAITIRASGAEAHVVLTIESA